jgi:predicted nucleic acid-binding protein
VKRVFVDTGAFFAHLIADDVENSRARHAFKQALLDALDLGFCDVERVSREDESRAVALVRAHEDKTYSLCDAMSLVVMERLGITDAIAFDRHFAEYGRFNLL